MLFNCLQHFIDNLKYSKNDKTAYKVNSDVEIGSPCLEFKLP